MPYLNWSCFSTDFKFNPVRYYFPTLGTLSANGSSLVGQCSDVTMSLNGTSSCATPTSSVLMDGEIPTLTGLDGNMWANQMLILKKNNVFSYEVMFDLRETLWSFDYHNTKIRKIELVMFNCPDWGMAATSFTINAYSYPSSSASYLTVVYPTVFSCTSLLKMCIPISSSAALFSLNFTPSPGSSWIYLAEVAFFNSSSSPCPAFTTIPGNTINPPPVTQSMSH